MLPFNVHRGHGHLLVFCLLWCSKMCVEAVALLSVTHPASLLFVLCCIEECRKERIVWVVFFILLAFLLAMAFILVLARALGFTTLSASPFSIAIAIACVSEVPPATRQMHSRADSSPVDSLLPLLQRHAGSKVAEHHSRPRARTDESEARSSQDSCPTGNYIIDSV